MHKLALLIVVTVLASACQTVVAPAVFTTVSQVQFQAKAYDADVIVVGSSLAGWASAVASARNGSTTILITETSCIGGQASCAGVSTWDGVGSGLDQMFRNGLESEYKKADVQLGGCYAAEANTGPDTFWPGANFCPHPDRVGDELLSWLNYYGVTLVGPVDVLEIGTNGVVTTADGILRSKIVIEATETGELIPPSLRRAVPANCKQSVTWVAGVREPGYGGAKLKDLVYPTDSQYMALLEDWWVSGAYHWAGLTGAEGLPVYRRTHDLNGDLVIYLNWMNDAVSAEVSRDLTYQMLVFLAGKGYGNWRWGMRSAPYLRTSDFRLNGQYRLGSVQRDVDSFSDSVSVSSYRTDAHGSVCGLVEEPYGAYDVPMRIGIPGDRVPVLVAMPRSADVSDSRATSFRMQPDEITFGEGMGTLASIAASRGVLPHDVPFEDVRRVLVKMGAKVDVS